MNIRRLSIRNFTSLANVVLADLPGLVILLGKNSSGKSNLIDALGLLFNEFGTDLDRDLGPAEAYQHLFANYDTNLAAPPEIAATLTLTSDDWATIWDPSGEVPPPDECQAMYLSKQLVIDEGRVIWRTDEVSWMDVSGEVTQLVKNGQPGEDIGQTDVQEWLRDIHSFLSTNFRVIRTTDISGRSSEPFAERPSILSVERVNRLWGLSQAQGNQRQHWFSVRTPIRNYHARSRASCWGIGTYRARGRHPIGTYWANWRGNTVNPNSY